MKITNDENILTLHGKGTLTFTKNEYAVIDAREDKSQHITVTGFHWIRTTRKTKIGRFIEAAKYLRGFV